MKKIGILHNPFILFIPILIGLIIYVFFVPTNGLRGDEPRYLNYAYNLIHGYYSPPSPNIVLLNGPGYPLVLIPFLLLKLPLISLTILNAIFFYLSIIFLYITLKQIVTYTHTLLFSFAWALYYLAYQNVPYIMTEPFTYLLITIFIYSTFMAFQSGNKILKNKYLIIAGFIFGYIVLTKLIFGYVLIIMLIGSGLIWILKRRNSDFKKVFFITTLAFLTTCPYLLYTYHLTGRLLYWGTGSDNIYWMSTPYKGEYGDWHPDLNINTIEFGNYYIHGADSMLRVHHQKEFEDINRYSGIERDDAYMRFAILNIKKHPLKYADNIIDNIGRLIFSYPWSQAEQLPKLLKVFPINGAILTLIILSLIPTFINWNKIPSYLQFLLIITLLYLGGSSIVCALVRMFTIIVPILFIWLAFIINHTVKIKLKINEESYIK